MSPRLSSCWPLISWAVPATASAPPRTCSLTCAFAAIDVDPAHLLVVAVDGTQVLATMQLSFLPGLARRGALRAQIEAVRVRQDHRSRGLGAVLFEWAIQEARRRDCALVQLTSRFREGSVPVGDIGV